MARTRSTANRTATVEVDAIDRLVAELNTLDGIEFARDAWVNEAPDVYGVVELSGTARQLWADGHLLDTAWNVIVTAYVNGADDTWPARLQHKLEELEDQGWFDTTHTNTRTFEYETGKVRWQWILMMYGPLTWTETVTGS